MLIVSDVSGAQQPLLVNDVHVTQQLSTIEQLDFTTYNTSDNQAGYNMLQPRTLITLPETGEMYRLSENDGQSMGNYYQRNITALQVLQDLDDHVVTGKLKGKQSLNAVMKFLTDGTKFTFSIHGSISDYTFADDFGGDHALTLFVDTIVTDYGIEFTTHGYHIDIYKSIGVHDAFVYLSGNDIYALADTGEYTQIRTHIIGYGKTDDNGKPTVKAEYTSPNSSVYGVIDDDIYSDDNATDQATLLAGMKAKLVDYPLIQYTANVNKFEKLSPADQTNDTALGNWGYLRDRNGLDVESRIIQKDVYPQSNQEDTLTFGNFMLDPNKMMVQLKDNHNSNYKEIEKLKISNNTTSFVSDFDIEKVGEVDD